MAELKKPHPLEQKEPEVIKVEEKKKDPKEELLAKVTAILQQYGGMESNIPRTHEYWTLMNDYRAALRGEHA